MGDNKNSVSKMESHDNPTAALTQNAAAEPEPEAEREMTVGEWLDIWLADYLADAGLHQ